jgi:hypothetical protein
VRRRRRAYASALAGCVAAGLLREGLSPKDRAERCGQESSMCCGSHDAGAGGGVRVPGEESCAHAARGGTGGGGCHREGGV